MTEVVTGEAVVLEVPCARFPSRALALAIHPATQSSLIAILFVAVRPLIFGFGILLYLLYHLRYFFGSFRRPLRQLSYLVGYYREAASLLAGARRFHRGRTPRRPRS